MKTPLTWVKNLYELGSPIRSAVARIQDAHAKADADLDKAHQAHREAMKAIHQDAAQLESQILRLWTAKEIDAAKRGFMLVDGKEIKL